VIGWRETRDTRSDRNPDSKNGERIRTVSGRRPLGPLKKFICAGRSKSAGCKARTILRKEAYFESAFTEEGSARRSRRSIFNGLPWNGLRVDAGFMHPTQVSTGEEDLPMAKENVLAVDDEEDILELVSYNLTKNGYQVTTVTTGEEAVRKVRSEIPDLILLDLMLPGVDGLEVCKILKNDPKTGSVPIMMLTAKGEEADIVTGLELGADDYMTKPFSPRVLLARVRALLRRKARDAGEDTERIQRHDLVIHPGRHEVLVRGVPVDLTHTELRLLHFLARRPGWVFTRNQIIDEVHGEDYAVTDRSVDVFVAGLRRKLGDCGKYVETVRGVGYRFKE
jgi:two-component system, OmpR family, alkaline phosphatase synthesis response regulator PhoP